jgi:hypothetical protein
MLQRCMLLLLHPTAPHRTPNSNLEGAARLHAPLAGSQWGETLFIDFGVDIPMSDISYMHINIMNGTWNNDGTYSSTATRTPRVAYSSSENNILVYQLLWQDASNQTLQWNFFDPSPVQALPTDCASPTMFWLYPGKGDWYPDTSDNYPNTVAPRTTRPPGKRNWARE